MGTGLSPRHANQSDPVPAGERGTLAPGGPVLGKAGCSLPVLIEAFWAGRAQEMRPEATINLIRALGPDSSWSSTAELRSVLLGMSP